ncbi:O-antigen ligase family protein [Brevundimonas sp. LjRoot202]|uniref:O-antigen ligase family protein n=1 Tax=Brevundimonas sp. LjRoot202 TaxID=3342281 RepID=UPI003ECFA23C
MAARHHILSPAALQALRRLAIFFAILMSGGNLAVPRIPLLILVLGICFLCRGPTFGLKRDMWAIGLLLFGVLIVATFGSPDVDLMALATRYANFLAGAALLGLYLSEPRDTIIEDLRPIFQFMGLQIIGTVLLALWMPHLFRAVLVDEAVYQTVFWVFTYHVTIAEAGGLVRPDGFFWEPGVFQIYMNIFLFMSLFVTRRRLDIALAIIGVLLLQSTTGLLIALMLFGIGFAQGFHRASPGEKLAAALLAPLLAAPLLFIAAENFTAKTTGAFRGSSWARTYDFYTGVNVILAHPLVGVGFDDERYKREAARLGYADTRLDYSSTAERSSSNGLIALIASIGIPMSLPFLVAIFRQRFFPKPLLFGMMLVLAFTGEALMLTPFFLMLLFSAMLSRKRVVTTRAVRAPHEEPGGYAEPAPARPS